jgi:chromosome partitioning protein
MQGKVLVAATSKGGAGKSTTIACLAMYWHIAGRKVALVDSDPNQTLSRWHGKGGALAKLELRRQMDEHAMIPTIAELAEAHDIVLVDCAGFGNQAMVFAIGAADVVLIPVMADEANVFEAMRTRKVVQSASHLTRRPITARTVLCRVKRAGVVDHARAQLVKLEAEPLTAQLNDRALFQEATFYGSSPTVLKPGSTAAQDIEAVAREIEPLLWARPAVQSDMPVAALGASPAA